MSEPGIGHNSKVPGVIAADQLRSLIERIEKLIEEKKALQGDISEVYGEAKGNGFDVRAIRAIVQRRAKDAEKLREEEAVRDLYLEALGML